MNHGRPSAASAFFNGLLGVELNPEYVELTHTRLQVIIRDKAAADTPLPQMDLFAA
jgi:hypothetical protein